MTTALQGLDAPRPTSSLRVGRPLRATAAVLALASVAACSTVAPTASPGTTAGQSAGPTTVPSGGPTPSPVVPTGGLEHPTGATDVVLRFEESGGFVPIEFHATYAPSFTLYGDGTVVFRDPYAPLPEPRNNVQLSVPFQTVKLDEAGIQALLDQALNRGGLAVATGPYTCNCADIPTATFTISVGGQTKQVSVTGMSPDVHPGASAAIVQQLAGFAEFLRMFADSVPGETAYVPAGYRGVLIESEQPFGPVVAWPWTDLTPADFTSGENEFFKTAALTPEQVDALGIEGAQGGMTGVSVQSEDKLYTFSLRPLLPDETE
jgi:hypothetical protein